MNELISLDEYYRPTTFPDLVGNPTIFTALQEKCSHKNIPHLLFYSKTPGTGKTSTAYVIIRSIYGKDWRQKHRVLEINASDDNGVGVVRTTIKDFARYSNKNDETEFRIIILDEADQMTPAAQAALRRILEIYKRRCRFILICNNLHKIIDPIQSRCSPFEFHPITPEAMIPRIKYICNDLKLTISTEALMYICSNTNGDVRTAINTFLEPIRNLKIPITMDTLKQYQVSGDELFPLVKDALNTKLVSARQKYYTLLKQGHAIKDLIDPFFEKLLSCSYPDLMKAEIIQSLVKIELGITQGSNELILIMGFLADCALIGEKYRRGAD